MADLLTPDQYMDLLLERQREHEAEHPPVGWVRTLPTWFISDATSTSWASREGSTWIDRM